VNTGRRALVVGPAWAGDMVMANALFQLLRRRGCTVDVLAPAWSLPLLARMPEVAEAIPMPARHGELALGARRKLGKRLRARDYRQAIVLPNSFKSALAPFFARIPRRTGYLGEQRYGLLNDIRRLDRRNPPHTAARYAALGADGESQVQTPRPRLSASPDNADALARNHGLHFSPPAVALCVGAEYGAARRWPAEHFAALADLAAEDGYQVWLLGSPNDAAVAAEVAAAANAATVNLCGKTSLPDVVDLLARAVAVVSNDSGLLHIAAAVGRPVVALYGSTPPAVAPPLCEVNSVLYLALACSPCRRRACPLGHFNCMRQLRPPQVMAEVRALAESP